MRLKKITIAISFLLLSSVIAYGAGNGMALRQKIVSYMRKAYSMPLSLKIVVGPIKSSKIRGLNKAVITVSAGERKQTQDIYISKDGKYLILGKVLNLTKSPFKTVLNKITLSDSPVRGNRSAKITVVEFADFECPFCKKAYPTVEDLMLKYAGKIKLVYKYFPLVSMHPWSMRAAIGAECAHTQSNSAFWYFYDHLYEQQESISSDNIKNKLKSYAKATKLNMKKFDTCFSKQQTKSKVERDMREGKSIGVSGTPTFVINGRIVRGAVPEQRFVQIINGILKRNKK